MIHSDYHIADAEIAEALVWHLWQEQLTNCGKVCLTDGRQLKILHTGTFNEDSGPDFLNAELSFGPGQPVRGDVEIHIRPVDWIRHGHGNDPRYNSVILHVVMWHDENPATVFKQNGQTVPTLVLSGCLAHTFDHLKRRYERRNQAPQERTYPCADFVQRTVPSAISHMLENAGTVRFLAKSRTFESRMERVSSEQTLYEGLMRCIGYSKNTDAFHELARRLPLSTIRDFTRHLTGTNRIHTVQALMFGVAGLLPSQSYGNDALGQEAASYIHELEARWKGLHTLFPVRVMDETDWQFFRLRPFNFPTVRMAGISYLVNTAIDEGLDTAFLKVLEAQPISPKKDLQAIRSILDGRLVHPEDDYWISHAVFGGATHAGQNFLIGDGRRREMMVNAVLSFLHAVCVKTHNHAESMVLAVFRAHPRLPDNTITRTMQTTVFARTPHLLEGIDTAQRQQGLMHIEEQTCYKKDCNLCVLNRG